MTIFQCTMAFNNWCQKLSQYVEGLARNCLSKPSQDSFWKSSYHYSSIAVKQYIYSYQCTTGSVLESKRPVIKGTSAELELSVQFKGTRSHFPNLSAKDCNWSLMPWLRTPEANQRYASSRGNVRYVLRTINGVDQRTYSFLFWLVLCFLQC